jgi:methyl-accepting chemotaxis protein
MTLQVELLEKTFARAKNENGGAHKLGLRFYERLFEKYPQVRPLFKTPPEQQHLKLMASIAAIVVALKDPERLLPYLHAMGIRHIAYGTENGHYAAVGENLIAVLKEHLSVEGEWTEAMEQAWSEALTAVSDIMIQAADNPELYSGELNAAGFNADGFRPDTNKSWELQPKSLKTAG